MAQMGKWNGALSTRDETLIESTSFRIKNVFDSVRFAMKLNNSMTASKSVPVGEALDAKMFYLI